MVHVVARLRCVWGDFLFLGNIGTGFREKSRYRRNDESERCRGENSQGGESPFSSHHETYFGICQVRRIWGESFSFYLISL